MTATKLTADEISLILTNPIMKPELPLDRQLAVVPREKIPDAQVIKDYTLTRVSRPAGSVLGEHRWAVATSKTEHERPIISYQYEYSLSDTELREAGRAGYDIVATNLMMQRVAMQRTLAQLLFQGTTAADRVKISGMGAVAYDVGDYTAQDANAWNTATKPLLHAAGCFDALKQLDVEPPYTWFLSENLEVGAIALNNAANPRSHEEIIKSTYLRGGDMLYFPSGDDAVATDGPKIYPMPAAANDDGVYYMCQIRNSQGMANFYFAEVTNGIESSGPFFDPANNKHTFYTQWRGTVVFRGATTGTVDTAPYIMWENDVDLA